MLIPQTPYVEPPSMCPSMTPPMTSSQPKTALCGSPLPTEQFDFQESLDADGKYVLFWNVNKTHIIFEVHVETKGYIGFGMSPNGKMYPADVVVGWVKDGVPHFKVLFYPKRKISVKIHITCPSPPPPTLLILILSLVFKVFELRYLKHVVTVGPV